MRRRVVSPVDAIQMPNLVFGIWLFSHIRLSDVLKKIGGFALAIVVAISCVQLGRWQLSRMETRQAWNHKVTQNLAAAPLPADQVLTSSHQSLEWRRVTFTGTFDPSHELLIRGRYFEGRYGYEVMTPLVASNQEALLVNRGWVPAGESATVAPQVPAPPQGLINIVGRVRLGDSEDRPGPSGAIIGLPAPAVNRIDPDKIASKLPYRALPGYVELIEPASDSPKALPPPQLSSGPHLAYAIQWFVFALLALAAPFFYRRIAPSQRP